MSSIFQCSTSFVAFVRNPIITNTSVPDILHFSCFIQITQQSCKVIIIPFLNPSPQDIQGTMVSKQSTKASICPSRAIPLLWYIRCFSFWRNLSALTPFGTSSTRSKPNSSSFWQFLKYLKTFMLCKLSGFHHIVRICMFAYSNHKNYYLTHHAAKHLFLSTRR